MTTDDEKLQMALAVFKHLGPLPGQVLATSDFIALAGTNGWRNLDVLDGVKAGYAKGFFDDGPNYGIQLTADGFAAVSPLNDSSRAQTVVKTIETSQAETPANSTRNEISQGESVSANVKVSEHDTPFPAFDGESRGLLNQKFSLRLPPTKTFSASQP
jgi:hypothetical protein